MDQRFVIKLQGKDFVTHEGLLNEFHVNGGEIIKTEIVSHIDNLIVFKAKVSGSKGEFTGHGDCSPNNVNKMILPHMIRMAETRAINRALRFYNNIGMCSVEELGGEEKSSNGSVKNDIKTAVPLICSGCGVHLSKVVADYSVRHLSKTLCRSCQDVVKEEKGNVQQM